MNKALEPSVTLGSGVPLEGSDLLAPGAPVAVMSEEDRLTVESHSLDVTVWLLILCIFTFFFIIIVAVICMQWMERRRNEVRGECLVLPAGPVPGCITVISTSQPHIRLLAHYHLQPGYCAAYGVVIIV
ncbi:uncharacterized protein [Procambarus clarkii]|uniref:uncharacterized protein isoform X2 n=1 Tax=Procambarus clarkii TaxID=6728 RepID=UPI001E673E36|nr:uncharacterized protein LOC123770072 isoform X2 [Procambarus clarkii]